MHTFFYTPQRPSLFEIELKSFSEKITNQKKMLNFVIFRIKNKKKIVAQVEFSFPNQVKDTSLSAAHKISLNEEIKKLLKVE